jgi:divinyl chlorophyllide a 8-vinyl-reductase
VRLPFAVHDRFADLAKVTLPMDTSSAITTPDAKASGRLRICVAGATGTIGSAVVDALVGRGHDVICLLRAPSGASGARSPHGASSLLHRAAVRHVDFASSVSLGRDGFGGVRFDAVISCMASRTGAPDDAWAVDHRAQLNLLEAALAAGVGQFVLLSAICVQKPQLAFQHAKLAFEQALIGSGMRYSVVRPTAFFKSLSGQIERVRKGKAFLVFGDGRQTSCKPISDDDLADYIADCLHRADRWNRILPIGGPGPAITPRQQGEALFEMMGASPKFRSVPFAAIDAVIAGLAAGGRVLPIMAEKAELARIGRYYARESMLVLNPETGQYDADATPSTGSCTLFDFYRSVLAGQALPERGDHAVF